jgi:hypothetical protein
MTLRTFLNLNYIINVNRPTAFIIKCNAYNYHFPTSLHLSPHPDPGNGNSSKTPLKRIHGVNRGQSKKILFKIIFNLTEE